MLTKAGIYLDANAGSPLKKAAREAILSTFSSGESLIERDSHTLVSNPSSIHAHGRSIKRALAESRENIAFTFGSQIDPEQLVFTSSGSEANQLAVRSVFEQLLSQGKKPHWITTPVEHDSNRKLVDWISKRGGSVSELPIDSQGRPLVEGFSDLVRPETALVSLVWVNNETGVVTDVHAFTQLSQKYSIPIHIDAAQAWGKIPLHLEHLGANFVSFSGHKIGGLAGVGVLWVKRGQSIDPLILGKQEKGRRGGTENTLGIIALGAASKGLDPLSWAARVLPIRNRLQTEIESKISGTSVNGGAAERIANTLNFNFEGVERDGLVIALDLAGYSVSSGSACSSGALEASHVLKAMGRTDLQAMAAVRVSLVDEMPWEALDGFISVLQKSVSRIRGATLLNKTQIQAKV